MTFSSALFRDLPPKEEEEFRKWARNKWTPSQKINMVWHPVVRQECAKILDEHIRKHVRKYDAGTLDWNFAFADMTVAIGLASDGEVSEDEQLEMAIEHFWEIEWERLTDGKD